MTYRTVFQFLLIALLLAVTCGAQDELPAIQDNSFLIEEAYNQEPNVVQHIFNVTQFAEPEQLWALSFTQEAPLIGQRLQISWTLPLQALGDDEELRLGNIAFHFRYQILGRSGGTAVAPRVSVVLPNIPARTSDEEGHRLQANVPISVPLSRQWVAHINAGATRGPSFELYRLDQSGPGNFEVTLTSYNLGTSVVWLAHANLNLLCEVVQNYNGQLNFTGDVVHPPETIMNPGIRAAINAPFGQFVPGIGFPIRFAEERTDLGVFLYLSFEHSVAERAIAQ
jgi:hypothetical protein